MRTIDEAELETPWVSHEERDLAETHTSISDSFDELCEMLKSGNKDLPPELRPVIAELRQHSYTICSIAADALIQLGKADAASWKGRNKVANEGMRLGIGAERTKEITENADELKSQILALPPGSPKPERGTLLGDALRAFTTP